MFSFVPRKVAQKSKSTRNGSLPSAAAPALTPSNARPGPSQALFPSVTNSTSDANRKQKQSEPAVPDQDLVALLSLSLSDHSLWLNVELRRALASADEGWLPLSALLHNSAYFAHLNARPPESAYAKSIRTHAADMFQVRMRVTAPSRSDWQGTDLSPSNDLGGYEVRRKDWRDALMSARNTTRQEWERSTVYMECIPLANRTVPRIYSFLSSLLGLPSTGQALSVGIQAILLPAHHLDRPGDIPKPKGFALVTFASADDASRLVTDWPWLPRRTVMSPQDGKHKETSGPAREAVKFGFRALPKVRWDGLKEEYLAHRQQLLDQIAQSEPEPEPEGIGYAAGTDRDREQDWNDGQRAAHAPRVPAHKYADPDAPFPPGCLVYVRGVHPETNRTTLKALFAARGFGPEALDYVDYSKGMGMCHLRLSAPHHAQALVATFDAHPLVQRQGLDSTGAEEGSNGEDIKAISMEVVEGAREELYWSKVPEKIRRDAVRKVIAQASSGGDENGSAREQPDAAREEGPGEQEGKRKRKRRRKV